MSSRRLPRNVTGQVVWQPPTTEYPYTYVANLLHIVDGDTQDFLVHWSRDIGFDIVVRQEYKLRTRSYGINAPEINRPDSREAGLAARDFVVWWFGQYTVGGTCMLVTHKDAKEKYGRYLAEIWSSDWAHCLNADLLNSGNAVEYLP